MTEAETVEQLVEFTNITLTGVSVFFTVISAYVAALNYFIGAASIFARALSFVFVTVVIVMLAAVMAGAVSTHHGLIARLQEIQADQRLSAAGRAILANATQSAPMIAGYSVDEIVRWGAWSALLAVLLAFFYLSFLHRWKPEIIPVSISNAADPRKS